MTAFSVRRRGDTALDRSAVVRLEPGDYVLIVAPPEMTDRLDRLFAQRRPVDTEVFGEFSFPGDVAAGALADAYGLTLTEAERGRTLDALLRQHLGRQAVVGDRVRLAGIELVADKADQTPFPPEERIGHRIALAARRRGVAIRPLGDVIVLMPAPAMPGELIERLCTATFAAIDDVLGGRL